MADPHQQTAAASGPLISQAAGVRILPFVVTIGFLLLEQLLARLGVDAQQLRWLDAVKPLP